MPFVSKKQQRFMFATKPEMAKEWAAETDFSKLPEKANKKVKEAAVSIDLAKIASIDAADIVQKGTAPVKDQQRAAIGPAVMAGLTPMLALGGAALGAARSPSVYGVQGAGRGALYGGSLGLGAGLGGLLGARFGAGGALAGSVLGGGLGMGGARLLMGQHPRQKDRDATEARQRMKAEEKARSKVASVNKLARLLCN
jgi:hypothetical protein